MAYWRLVAEEEERRRRRIALGLPPEPSVDQNQPPPELGAALAAFLQERMGPLAVPTGTETRTPQPGDKPAWQKGPSDIPGVQRAIEFLQPAGDYRLTGKYPLLRTLGAALTAEEEYPGANLERLQRAGPIETIMMGGPVGAPVGSIAGAVPKLRQIPGVAEAVARAGVKTAIETGGVTAGIPRTAVTTAARARTKADIVAEIIELRKAQGQRPLNEKWLSGLPKSNLEQRLAEHKALVPKAQVAAGQAEMPVVAVAGKPVAAAKEPWQMTRGEYRKNVEEELLQRGQQLPQRTAADSYWNSVDRTHRRDIADALSEGKPVPANVLAEYPDLAKPATQPVAPVTERVLPTRGAVEPIRKTAAVSETLPSPAAGEVSLPPPVVPRPAAPTGVTAAEPPPIYKEGVAGAGGGPPVRPTATGGVPPTPDEANAALGRLTQFIHSPESLNLSDLTLQIRSKQVAQRAAQYQSRTVELLTKGLKYEDAMKQAQGETMSGAFDRPLTTLSEVMADQFRDSAFARVYEVLKNEPLERLSTTEALTNALMGKGIPRIVGTTGGSAYTRLSRVFPPEVMAILEKDKALTSVFEETLLQSGERYKFITPQGKWPPPFEMMGEQLPVGLPGGKAAAEAMQRPQPLTPGQLFDLESFGMAKPVGVSRPLYEAPIEAAIKMPSMLPIAHRNLFAKVGKEIELTAMDIANLIRANKASVDVSWLRQMVLLAFNHADDIVAGLMTTWKAARSQSFAKASELAIKQSKNYALYEEFGVARGHDFLRPLEYKGIPAWQREESFIIMGGDRPIAKFAEKLPWLPLSQRVFVTGINTALWRIWNGYVDDVFRYNLKIASGAIKMKPGEAFSMEKSLETHAAMLANMSGRGGLGPLKELSPAINAGFFSMRLNLGRICTPQYLVSADPLVRKEAWKNIISAVGSITAIELVGEQMGLWHVEADPRSANFAKIRILSHTFDPWGGFQQYVVLLARLATLKTKSATTGQMRKADFRDLLVRFEQGKESPGAALISDFVTGERYSGEKTDIRSWKQWADRIAPMSLWDMYEAAAESGAVGLLVGVPSGIGVGVVTMTPRRQWQPSGSGYVPLGSGQSSGYVPLH